MSKMDWDENIPKKPSSRHSIGEPLENLAIRELELRIKALEDEINRVKDELLKKKAHNAVANSLFNK